MHRLGDFSADADNNDNDMSLCDTIQLVGKPISGSVLARTLINARDSHYDGTKLREVLFLYGDLIVLLRNNLDYVRP